MVLAKLISILLLTELFHLGDGQTTFGIFTSQANPQPATFVMSNPIQTTTTLPPNPAQPTTTTTLLPNPGQSSAPLSPPPVIQNPCQFTVTANQNSPGGILMGFISLADCQNQCQLQSNQCNFGFDFKVQNSECWFSTNTALSYSPGVNHHSCNQQSVQTQPYSSSPASLTSILPPQSTPILLAPCEWKEMINTNSKGGTPDPAPTLTLCKVKCLTINNCANGLDWVLGPTSGPRCFISNTMQLGTLVDVSHHICVPPPKEQVVNSANRDRIFISGVTFVLGLTLMQWLI